MRGYGGGGERISAGISESRSLHPPQKSLQLRRLSIVGQSLNLPKELVAMGGLEL
jgi:hypothetical protein